MGFSAPGVYNIAATVAGSKTDFRLPPQTLTVEANKAIVPLVGFIDAQHPTMVATVAVLAIVASWNQFLLPVALNTNTDNYVLTQGMAAFASQAGYSVDFGALFAAVVITVAPAALPS